MSVAAVSQVTALGVSDPTHVRITSEDQLRTSAPDHTEEHKKTVLSDTADKVDTLEVSKPATMSYEPNRFWYDSWKIYSDNLETYTTITRNNFTQIHRYLKCLREIFVENKGKTLSLTGDQIIEATEKNRAFTRYYHCVKENTPPNEAVDINTEIKRVIKLLCKESEQDLRHLKSHPSISSRIAGIQHNLLSGWQELLQERFNVEGTEAAEFCAELLQTLNPTIEKLAKAKDA